MFPGLRPIVLRGVLLCLCAPTIAVRASGPTEHLVQTLPPGFVIGDSAIHGQSERREYVPAGETVHDWSDMITLQVFHGLHPASPAAFLVELWRRWSAECPGTPPTATHTGTAQGHPVSMLLLQCPRLPVDGKPESALIRAIQGNDTMFVAQYAVRSMFGPPARQKAYDFLKTVQVGSVGTP